FTFLRFIVGGAVPVRFSFFFSLPISLTPSPSNQFQRERTKKVVIVMGDSNPIPRLSVHQALGGGPVADVLLWRKWCGGVVMLASATTLWYLFERAGYNFLSFVANVLLLLVVILFFWAKSASLLNRPLPPLPNLEISEKTVGKVADELQVWINYALSIAHDIAIGRNLKLFLEVAVGLWLLSYIGSLFNFLTLVYIGEFYDMLLFL
ncbi:Reticulon family protein isoform 2, partial [Theobroma cacao]